MIPSCPELETCCAYVDGSLRDGAARSIVAAHLAVCDRCAVRVAALRVDLAEAEGLSSTVQTPPGLLSRARAIGSSASSAGRPPWWSLAAAAVLALAATGAWWFHLNPGPAAPGRGYALVERAGPKATMGFAGETGSLDPSGPVRALVIFTRFDGAQDGALPEGADGLLSESRRGSVGHYYERMSFGRLRVGGQVLPRRYGTRYPARAYEAPAGSQWGNYQQYVLEVLRQVDEDVDLARFDGDGPDGVPNSGDDDGVVDYVFMVLQDVPEGFISGTANALVGLGLERPYATADLARDGDPVIVSGATGHGALLREGGAAEMAEAMCHLMGHSLGLGHPTAPAGGLSGGWDLMGPGAGDGGRPAALGAGHREHLGWLAPPGERVVTVSSPVRDLRLADLQAGGRAVRVPLDVPTTGPRQYLLVEAQFKESQAYGRGDGLLIWRVEWMAGEGSGGRPRHLELLCAPPGDCEGAARAITNIRRVGDTMVIDVDPQG